MNTKMLLPAFALALAFAAPRAAVAATLDATPVPETLRAAVHEVLARDAAARPEAWSEQHVLASDGAIDDRFGTSVAVAGDLAVIGAFDAKVGDNYQQGAVYVFAKTGDTWAETQKLVASDGAGMANFGAAVSIANGDILASAIGANVAGQSNQGAVYVFENEGGVWAETQKLVASDGGSGDAFGNAIAATGAIALVGAKGATVNGQTLQGKVYVLASDGGTWSEQQVLMAADGAANDLFGGSVAIDGDVALVGAPTLTYNFMHAGFAYVFRNDGGTWSQTQKLLPAETAIGDQFGYAVGLAGDTALITSTGNQFAHGAAYVFRDDGTTWSETQVLSPGDSASGDEFGNALAIAGTRAVIGAERLVLGEHQGAAYVFSAANGVWTQTDEFTETSGTSLDFFGGSVAFDGATALVGIPGATVDETHFVGAAVFYTSDASTTPPEQEVEPSDGASGDEFGISVAVEGDTALIGAAYENSGQGAAYVFTASDGVWSESQKLVADDGMPNDWFGQSVALDGDVAVIGAPQYLDAGNGAAYVFTRAGASWSQAHKLVADDGASRDQFGISV
ncbi:MAG: FG-GAP repeat protein, partial [Rhodanobacteraceae bacterium]